MKGEGELDETGLGSRRRLLHDGRSLCLCAALALALLAACQAAPALAAGPPQIPSSWVTDVTPTSAVLRAEVNPEGLPTSYRFQYLTAAQLEANLAAGHEAFAGSADAPATPIGVGAGSLAQLVAFTLVAPSNPLAPDTAYRFRALAANSAGPAAGPTRAFRTDRPGPAPGLPDGRAWELVSPLDKRGGSVAAPGALFGGGDLQAAGQGGALTYGSATAFGSAVGAPPSSQYLSRRGAGGWSTENLTAPTISGAYGDHPDGAPYRLFSPDLARALMADGGRCGEGETCPRGYSLRELPGGPVSESPSAPGLRLAGAASDLRHVVFAVEGNLYEWSGEGLSALNVLPGDSAPTPGAQLAAPRAAISEDGARVYFIAGEDGYIYLREVGSASTKWVDEAVGGSAHFEGAAADGGVAFFAKAGHLYRYLAATDSATDIAPGGEVAGVLGASASGDTVYFQDAVGLERWHQGTTTLVAVGADAAAPSDYQPATIGSARISADGRQLAFLSAAAIDEYDNLDAGSGQPDTELYLYDAGEEGAARLICASCNPSGERPQGSASIPGAEVNGTTTAYLPRVLSADGRRLFFETSDDLLGSDTDARTDVYQWERAGEGDCTSAPGCLRLISGGRGEGGRLIDASGDGADVFFLTGDALVSSDPGSIDAYDARIGGGLPQPQAPIACIGDACQALPNPPADPTPGTLVPNAGNPTLKIEKIKPHKHKQRHHRHHRRRSRG
jgi:hypothetical protein